MAELSPAPFADLVTRLFVEPRTQASLFELPRRKWYLPAADTPDLSVRFHGRTAGNAAGPAAGPHTQMAQNLLLSYAAGGRILELKTVQINDELTIGRPCIDMTNVGFNIEWSQELRIAESLSEYVAGSMLIAMFRASREHTGGALDGTAGDVIFDLSVGYDLAGIRSPAVRGFLDGMRDAAAHVSKLRSEIPVCFRAAREAEYPSRLSDSITLSTFHGCPANEIERICEFLIGECDFDVIVKMNPPTLGRDQVEHLLHDVLGYNELTVNPAAYAAAISFAESVDLSRRLTAFAAARGRRVGFKFSNTLEVLNHREFFPRNDKIMYLSGQPLYVLALALTDEFRRAAGPDVPISFSAGIDQHNFSHAVACGFVPVTASSDLLRPGGYGRFSAYVAALANDMRRCGATNVDEFILRRFAAEADAAAPQHSAPQSTVASVSDASSGALVRAAAVRNTTIAARLAREDSRYAAARNRNVPKRIDSRLKTFDCITCDKCLPVCPNAANFLYPTPIVAFETNDWIVAADGTCRPGATRAFAIEKPLQIACYSDFCNECGNCDTFCPEYGGPYIQKPTFFGSERTWERAAPRDGFVVGVRGDERWISGRVRGSVFRLQHDRGKNQLRFTSENVAAVFDDPLSPPTRIECSAAAAAEQTLDMWVFHTLRHLLAGVLNPARMNQVNAGLGRESAGATA